MPNFKLELIVTTATKAEASQILATVVVVLSADPPITEAPVSIVEVRISDADESVMPT